MQIVYTKIDQASASYNKLLVTEGATRQECKQTNTFELRMTVMSTSATHACVFIMYVYVSVIKSTMVLLYMLLMSKELFVFILVIEMPCIR